MEDRYLTRDKIIGKQVIDSEAKIMGTVKDLAFDLVARGISLTINTVDDREMTIDGSSVIGVGDVILLNTAPEASSPGRSGKTPKKTQTDESSQPQDPGTCPECGYQNDPGNKFCIKCGSEL